MENKRLKVCLLWGTIYSGNLGVGALTYSAIYILEKISNSCGVTVEYLLIGTQHPDIHTGHLDVDGRFIEFDFIPSKYFYLPNILFSFANKKVLEQLRNVDIVLDLGQGDSFTDIYGFKRFTNNVLSKLIFLALGKEIVILPQTIGPFKNDVTRFLSRAVLNKMKYVMLRDKMSFEYIKSLKVKSEYGNFIDMAFILPYSKKHKNGGELLVGINISGLLYNGGYNQKNLFSLKFDYKEFINQLILNILQMEDVQIVLVPHVSGKGTKNIEDDFAAMIEVKKKHGAVQLLEPFLDPREAKSEISRLDVLIASRMHACIAAFSTGVPIVGVAYSRKFKGLFQETLKYEAVIDATVCDQDTAISQIMLYLTRLTILKNETQKGKEVFELLINNLENEITSIIHSKIGVAHV